MKWAWYRPPSQLVVRSGNDHWKCPSLRWARCVTAVTIIIIVDYNLNVPIWVFSHYLLCMMANGEDSISYSAPLLPHHPFQAHNQSWLVGPLSQAHGHREWAWAFPGDRHFRPGLLVTELAEGGQGIDPKPQCVSFGSCLNPLERGGGQL